MVAAGLPGMPASFGMMGQAKWRWVVNTMVWLPAPAVSLCASVALALVDGAGLPAVTPATARWLRGSAASLVTFLGDDVAVERVSPQDVARWVAHESARGLSAVGINSKLRGVKTLYARLQANGVTSVNPVALVRFLPEPPPRPRAVAEADYLAMRAAAGNARDEAILDVLWASGCRLAGLLSMRVDRMERWQDGGRECFALLVVEKFGRSRWVYVGRDELQGQGLADWLAGRPTCAAPWLWLAFARPFGQLSPVTVQGVLRRCRLAAGIPSSRPTSAHAFRHAFALRMLDAGEDLAAVSAWLGHHSPEFTAAVYARRSEQALREKYFG